MKRTNSSDYAALDRSLKRVKISTSPGELRLDRDFEDLQAGRSWTSSTNSSECPSWDRPRGRVQELCCHNGCIARDLVDPLRLRLIYVYQEPSSTQGSPVPPERWSFFITVPRMYPHAPPVVTNVTRDFASAFYSENSNTSIGEERYPSASRTGTVIMQNQAEPPLPEACLVNHQPPSWPRSHAGTPPCDSKTLCIDAETAQFPNWTPLCGIGDLVSWLMTMPARRREWWSEESNRRKHHAQLHRRRNAAASPVGAQPLPEPTASERLCNETDEVGAVMMDTSPRKTDSNPCSVNRFDVGYSRVGTCDLFMSS